MGELLKQALKLQLAIIIDDNKLRNWFNCSFTFTTSCIPIYAGQTAETYNDTCVKTSLGTVQSVNERT